MAIHTQSQHTNTHPAQAHTHESFTCTYTQASMTRTRTHTYTKASMNRTHIHTYTKASMTRTHTHTGNSPRAKALVREQPVNKHINHMHT